jgi:hypothetical protein
MGTWMRYDQGRPFCGQCAKSKLQCTGYQRSRHFKNLSALDRDTLIIRKQLLNPITEPSFIEYDHSEHHYQQGARNVRTKSSILEQSESVSTSVSQLFEYYLSDYIPQGEKAKQDPPVSWLQTVQDTGNLGKTTSPPLAITGLSLVRLGRKHQNVELQSEGMAVYGQALEGIQAILSSDDLIFEEQTLASCMTLLAYDVSPIFRLSHFVGAVHSDMQTMYSKHPARMYGDG